jgi:hypothetical protein
MRQSIGKAAIKELMFKSGDFASTQQRNMALYDYLSGIIAQWTKQGQSKPKVEEVTPSCLTSYESHTNMGLAGNQDKRKVELLKDIIS